MPNLCGYCSRLLLLAMVLMMTNNHVAVVESLPPSPLDSASPYEAVNDVGAPYLNDKVIKIFPAKDSDVAVVQQLREALNLDFWTEPVPGVLQPVVVRVPGAAFDLFERNITQQGITMTLSPLNVAEQVRREYASNAAVFHQHTLKKRAMLTSNLTKASDGPVVVGAFASYSAICSWMEDMCRRYSGISTCMDIGLTSEKRKMKLMKLGFPGINKKALFMDANIHSREWVSGAAAVWLMNKLLTGYRSDPNVFDLLSRVDLYVLPIANPDGYEYSRQPAQRYWRKTRSRTTKPACYGADPNRNFGYQWGTNGASTNPCAEVFQGASPFSEPETRAIADFVRSRKRDIIAYFAVHSYGNYWLVPWGFSGAAKPYDFDEMMRVARLGTNAITRGGGDGWKVGNTVDLLYPAAGGSDDWAKSEGIKYSYTLELRPSSDDPQFGFVVESTEIEPAGQDLLSGVNTATKAILVPSRLRSMRYGVRRRVG